MTEFSSGGQRPAPPDISKLRDYWDAPVWRLAQLDEPPLSEPQKERHRIYTRLLMAMIDAYWNGFKRGRAGHYPWNEVQDMTFPYEYKGHNIGAIAVDRRGRVLDFDFNHNKLFNSSAEHAEARLVRRIFALAQIADVYEEIEVDEVKRLGEYDMLSEVTIYTSLESCAQCAGMMALGNVKAVMYLQVDPGMYMIGNLLRNLSGELPRAPRPIRATEIGLENHSHGLDDAFKQFAAGVAEKPFWQADVAKPDRNVDDHQSSISSFLCTAAARAIFRAGRAEFENLVSEKLPLEHPDERSLDRYGKVVPESLTNREAVENAERFLNYALHNGRRGTTHRA